MRLDHVLCVLFVLGLIIILTPGCGWVNPHTTVTGGRAGGQVIRDEVTIIELEPVSPPKPVSTKVETAAPAETPVLELWRD